MARFEPTFLLSVPRVFEKVYNGAEQKAIAGGKGKIFARAVDVAVAELVRAAVRLLAVRAMRGEPPPARVVGSERGALGWDLDCSP
jgi:long-subunit acyl-CoA synthetase (AMP-forming)